MSIRNRMGLRPFTRLRSLGLMVILSGSLVGTIAGVAGARDVGILESRGEEVQERQPATTVAEWMAQVEASRLRITGVQIQETEAGLEIVLETANGELADLRMQRVDNAAIADIPNAVLAWPDGDSFEQFDPAAGMTLVSVTNETDGHVRITITGTDVAPVAEVTATGLTVTLGEAVAGVDDDVIQLIVTGEQDEGYNPSSASVGTRTETPLRDIPRSIQVIPRQVIEDQQADNINQVLENIPGAVPAVSSGTPFAGPVIRGFGGFTSLTDLFRRNGLRDPFGNTSAGETANIERIEVIRGPASVLYGQGTSGGIVNIVTKQPLSESFYEISGSAGSYDSYRGAVDLSGPLNNDGTLSYRLNLAAGTEGRFVDFYDRDRYVAAAVLDWRLSEDTRLILDAEYLGFRQNGNDFGLPAIGTVLDNPNGEIPRNRYIGDPEFEERVTNLYRGSLRLEHDFSENWGIRSAFNSGARISDEFNIFHASLEDDNRTLNRNFFDSSGGGNNTYAYTLDTYVTGSFNTGSIQHQLVAGVELSQQEEFTDDGVFGSTTSIDLFDPDYGNLVFTPIDEFDDVQRQRGLGLYIQDQISLLDNLILVLGGRFDIVNVRTKDFIASTTEFQQDEAFSPQVGIVYNPIEPISLYASYSRSFLQTVGRTFDNSIFEPQRGTQYEIGLKADINERLSTTLALYDLTRSNVQTEDPNNPGFRIQTGEQNSQGVELNIAGEILPGWNITAGYAYDNARIREDNTFDEGNRLNNAPENALSLWTTYRILGGNLSGLGLGLGLFYVGERQGDLANTFTLPDYLRTDAAIFYERNQFRAAVNVRNLFDIDYFEAAQNAFRVAPGEPLTLSASVSWKF